jgi:asparagine synthase (glutamine-hydrolysing)
MATISIPDYVDFDSLEWKHEENTRHDDPRAVELAAACRRRLTEAVEKIAARTRPETRGLILSGGVDTCAILEAAASGNVTFALAITVVIGENSPDERYARYAAHQHGLKHSIVRMTPQELVQVHLPRTIKTLQVWDGMTIRNSLVISAAFQEAQTHGLTDVLVGDGADELFGGYSFTWGTKDDPVGWKEKRDSMCREWTFATDDLAESYGLVAHAPYEDQELMVDWALNETQRHDCVADDRCQIQLNLGGPYEVHTTGKVLLREAFQTGSSWRRKDPIEVGSGATVIGKDDYWTRNGISDEEFESEAAELNEQGVIVNSKEYLVNIRIYKNVFGGIVHPTKKRLSIGEGCFGCCFEIGEKMFCHLCGAYPAQRWKVAETENAKKEESKS